MNISDIPFPLIRLAIRILLNERAKCDINSFYILTIL